MRDAIARTNATQLQRLFFCSDRTLMPARENLGFPDLLSERYSFPKINPEARTYFPSDDVLEERGLSEVGAFRRGRFGSRKPRACGG